MRGCAGAWRGISRREARGVCLSLGDRGRQPPMRAALGAFLGATRADTLHLVGHSLGGLVILKLFERGGGADLPPGRIVLLGPPLRGSRAARNLARLPFGKTILGRGIQEEALAAARPPLEPAARTGGHCGRPGIGRGPIVRRARRAQRRHRDRRGNADRGRGRPRGAAGESHRDAVVEPGGAAGGGVFEDGAVRALGLVAAIELLQAEQQVQCFARAQGVGIERAQGFEGGG